MTQVLKVIKSGDKFRFRIDDNSVVLDQIFSLSRVEGGLTINHPFTQDDVDNGYWESADYAISFLNGKFESTLSLPLGSQTGTPDIDILAKWKFLIDYVSPTFTHGHNISVPASRFVWSDDTNYVGSFGGSEDGLYHSFSNQSVVRSLTVSRPEELSNIDYSSAPASVSITPLYVGEWITISTATITYTTPSSADNRTVQFIDTIYSSRRTYVENSNDMCCLYSALKNTYERYNNARCNNTELAKRYKDDLIQVSNLFSLAYNAISCAKFDDVSMYVSEAKRIANVNDCSCPTASGDLILNVFGEAISSDVVEDSSGDAEVSIVSNTNILSVDEPTANSFEIGLNQSNLNTLIAGLTSITNLGASISTLSDNVSNVETLISELETSIGDAPTLDNSSATDVYAVIGDLDSAISSNAQNHQSIKTISYSFTVDYSQTGYTEISSYTNLSSAGGGGFFDVDGSKIKSTPDMIDSGYPGSLQVTSGVGSYYELNIQFADEYEQALSDGNMSFCNAVCTLGYESSDGDIPGFSPSNLELEYTASIQVVGVGVPILKVMMRLKNENGYVNGGAFNSYFNDYTSYPIRFDITATFI